MQNKTTVEPNADVMGMDQPTSRNTTKQKTERLSSQHAAKSGNKSANDRKRADRPALIKKGVSRKGKSNTKKEQLIALLSKPNGAKLAVLIERLEWQSHTVRAALSGLRKQGFEISTSKSAKGGETVYAIISEPSAAANGKPAASA